MGQGRDRETDKPLTRPSVTPERGGKSANRLARRMSLRSDLFRPGRYEPVEPFFRRMYCGAGLFRAKERRHRLKKLNPVNLEDTREGGRREGGKHHSAQDTRPPTGQLKRHNRGPPLAAPRQGNLKDTCGSPKYPCPPQPAPTRPTLLGKTTSFKLSPLIGRVTAWLTLEIYGVASACRVLLSSL